LNAVLEVELEGDPQKLLSELQRIEAAMGRPAVREVNSPRVVDLDILYCGDWQCSTSTLTIPHPRLHLRRFVLLPLAEICPGLYLPGVSGNIQELLAKVIDPTEAKRASQQWEPL
jgi:2-amino-4-hydroxy-6-hydroxymethyldihydropteridine diphosphokinase